MNAQYLHVSQFYQTILCFSLLLLIVQKIVIICKDLNQQYLKSRTMQFDDQLGWKKSQNQKQMQNIQYKKNVQPQLIAQSQRQTLKTSLIQGNQNNQNQKTFVQGQEEPKRISQQKKQLTQFKNAEQLNQNAINQQIKVQNRKSNKSSKSNKSNKSNQRKSHQQKTKQRRMSQQTHKQLRNNQRRSKDNKEVQSKANIKTKQQHQDVKAQNLNFRQTKVQANHQQMPQMTDEDSLQKEYKGKQKIRYFKRIDSLFNEYFAIIIPALVIGILVHSAYIFTMVCFFGFIFSSLLFNYANLLTKLKSKPNQESIFTKTNKLISGLFVIALFISYWSDNQFS